MCHHHLPYKNNVVSQVLWNAVRSLVLLLLIASILAATSLDASAQAIAYQTYSPVVPMVQNYVPAYRPSGNYAAVTAFSPPMTAVYATPVLSAPVVAAMPSSSMGVTSYYTPQYSTSYYAPAAVTSYSPTSAFYAAQPVTSYYAPTTAYYASPTALPVTSYYAPAVSYAPTAVAWPMRRRWWGGYRPVPISPAYAVPAY